MPDFDHFPRPGEIDPYGHCPNSFRPPPPPVKRAKTEKIVPNHHGKPLLKQQQQQQQQQPLLPYRQCTYMETTYFKNRV